MQENYLKLSLYQENVLFYEGIIDNTQFHPQVKKNIDIRSLLPDAIRSLQKVLSKRKCDFILPTGKHTHYNNEHEVINHLMRMGCNNLDYNPVVVEKKIMGRVYTGVEFKLGFYLNDKTIVERDFYVNGFNPMSRYNVEVTYQCNDILNNIVSYIKMIDINNICDEIKSQEYLNSQV